MLYQEDKGEQGTAAVRAKLRGLRRALFLEVDTSCSLAERMAQANCQEFDLSWAGNPLPHLVPPLSADGSGLTWDWPQASSKSVGDECSMLTGVTLP